MLFIVCSSHKCGRGGGTTINRRSDHITNNTKKIHQKPIFPRILFPIKLHFLFCTSFLDVILVLGKDGKLPFQTAVDVYVGNIVDVDVGDDVYVGDDVDVDVGDDMDVDVGGAQELAGYLAIWTERLTGTGWAPLRAKMLTDAHQPRFIVNKRKLFGFFFVFHLH